MAFRKTKLQEKRREICYQSEAGDNPYYFLKTLEFKAFIYIQIESKFSSETRRKRVFMTLE